MERGFATFVGGFAFIEPDTQSKCFPSLLDLFHIFIWERAHRKSF